MTNHGTTITATGAAAIRGTPGRTTRLGREIHARTTIEGGTGTGTEIGTGDEGSEDVLRVGAGGGSSWPRLSVTLKKNLIFSGSSCT
jgi:hypothetical protein